jgi:hypothetical protein
MKFLTFLLLCLVCGEVNWAQNLQKPALAKLIDSLYVIDQQVQTDIMEANKNGASPEKMQELFAFQFETFKKHIPIVKKIVAENGYPTIELVGKESSNHFFLLVQHADADLEFQGQMLKFIKEEVKKSNVQGSNFAYLTDRVLLGQGKSQLFGSQLEYNQQGNALARNLAKPKTVNKRRSKYGMESLEAYLQKASDFHKQMNPGKYN